jgi:hypothetical protein
MGATRFFFAVHFALVPHTPADFLTRGCFSLLYCSCASQPLGGESAVQPGCDMLSLLYGTVEDVNTWLNIYQKCMPIINTTSPEFPNGVVPTYFTM